MEDSRAYLKVKIKSLAEEARIIRKEERQSTGDKREGLHLHRVGPVRREARHSLVAYGFIRGLAYEQIESKCPSSPDWEKVKRMVVKYGLTGYGWKIWKYGEQEAKEKLLLERFEKWKDTGL